MTNSWLPESKAMRIGTEIPGSVMATAIQRRLP